MRPSASPSRNRFLVHRPFPAPGIRHFAHARFLMLLKWPHSGHLQSKSCEPPERFGLLGTSAGTGSIPRILATFCLCRVTPLATPPSGAIVRMTSVPFGRSFAMPS